MTRVLTIVLIILHLMNIIGSYGIVAKLAAVHEIAVSNQLDEDEYVGSNTITLKVPFSLPYLTNTGNYERAIGKIEYEGHTYHMVKHKFYNDTLFIVCLKDAKLTEINETLADIAASMADTRDSKHSNKSKLIAQVKDFELSSSIQVTSLFLQLQSLELPDYSFSVIVNSESPLLQPPRS